jgi:outer membrane lipoprotein-sorting protein
MLAYRKAGASSERRQSMKKITTLAAAIAVSMFVSGYAQADSCKAQSAEKKLAGAAQKSFLTKCEKDAKTACDTQAAEKKLAGAAKNSFTKKCVTDATGT